MKVANNTEPDWNYAKNGADWTMGTCAVSSLPQAPFALDESATVPPTDWALTCDVSFLTAWQNANITKEDYGFKNYVYRINATDGNLGLYYATESFVGGPQILWNVTQIRFHYPSEHTINGDSFDLEM